MNHVAQDAARVAQQELAIKLEGIFMPHARKQRDAFYRDSKVPPGMAESARFVHYTTAEAALEIISNKRIWMRNTVCMTDYSEVQHGFEMLQKFFSDETKIGAFKTALDTCVPGAADEALDLFNRWWNDIRFHTYITSVSEHYPKEDTHGRLSMWRAFGANNSSRVALVLNVPWFSGSAVSLNVVFSPVAYLTEEETHEQVYTVMQNIREKQDFLQSVDRQFVVNSVFFMLLTGVTCLKHEGFREEREWRGIYSPHRTPSDHMKRVTKVVNGIPQIVYELPLDERLAPELSGLEFSRVFDRLIVGPTQFPVPMFEAFREALDKAGVSPESERPHIFISGIPIRC
jgi:hypothetical protein